MRRVGVGGDVPVKVQDFSCEASKHGKIKSL